MSTADITGRLARYMVEARERSLAPRGRECISRAAAERDFYPPLPRGNRKRPAPLQGVVLRRPPERTITLCKKSSVVCELAHREPWLRRG